jgi:hypothetical protein
MEHDVTLCGPLAANIQQHYILVMSWSLVAAAGQAYQAAPVCEKQIASTPLL